MDNVKYSILKAKELGCNSFFIEQNRQKFSVQFDEGIVSAVSSKELYNDSEKDIVVWKSPMVGYIQIIKDVASNISENKVYVKVTALGLSHDINFPFEAEVSEWYVQDGDPVTFGQPIAILKRKDK